MRQKGNEIATIFFRLVWAFSEEDVHFVLRRQRAQQLHADGEADERREIAVGDGGNKRHWNNIRFVIDFD